MTQPELRIYLNGRFRDQSFVSAWEERFRAASRPEGMTSLRRVLRQLTNDNMMELALQVASGVIWDHALANPIPLSVIDGDERGSDWEVDPEDTEGDPEDMEGEP